MHSRYSYILSLVLVLGIYGCTNLGDGDKKWVFNLDNQFELNMREVLNPEERTIEFRLTALDPVECDSSSLVLESKTFLTTLEIDVTDLEYESTCTGSGSFPEGTISIPSKSKTYELNINILDFIDHQGSFSITRDQLILDLADSPGLIAPIEQMNIIPNNFVWGFHQTFNNEEISTINNFFENNSLQEITTELVNEGIYSYFSIDRFANVTMPNLPEKGAVKTFAFVNVDFDILKEAWSQLKTEYPDLKATFYFSDGSVL